MAGLWKSNFEHPGSSPNLMRESKLGGLLRADLRAKACIKDIQDGCETQEELDAKAFEAGMSLRDLKKAIMDYTAFANQPDNAKEKEELMKDVETYVASIKRNIDALNQANVVAQKHVEARYRDELLYGGSQVKQRGRADKETLLRSTTGMTESLFSVSRMMADQVKHSENALEVLVGTSTVISDTQEESRNMSNAILQSKKLLTKYGRREMTDRVLIFLAIVFFFACVLYVLKGRLF